MNFMLINHKKHKEMPLDTCGIISKMKYFRIIFDICLNGSLGSFVLGVLELPSQGNYTKSKLFFSGAVQQNFCGQAKFTVLIYVSIRLLNIARKEVVTISPVLIGLCTEDYCY